MNLYSKIVKLFIRDQFLIDEVSDENKMQRTGSQESPSTPLFDDDVSQPLEDFPRVSYTGDGWDMYLRQPNKKKFTAQRFWKKIFLKIAFQNDTPIIQMFNTVKDKEPFSGEMLSISYF